MSILTWWCLCPALGLTPLSLQMDQEGGRGRGHVFLVFGYGLPVVVLSPNAKVRSKRFAMEANLLKGLHFSDIQDKSLPSPVLFGALPPFC